MLLGYVDDLFNERAAGLEEASQQSETAID